MTALALPDWTGSALRAAAALALVPLVLLTIWLWMGWSRPSFVLVLEGFQMWALAPSWVILAGALWGRSWAIAAVAGVVALSHLALCLPAATGDDVPAWVAGSPTVTVYVANVRYDNHSKPAVADEVLDADADIVILNEMTADQHDLLGEAGVFERYPTEVYAPGRPFGEMLLTRLPASEQRIEFIGGARVPAVMVTVGDTRVRVHSVHVHAPKSSAQRYLWRRNLIGIGDTLDGSSPQLYAGDFNSAPWHGPYRDLLSRGLKDAHDALGQGLSRSWTPKWPGLDLLGPLMRLDHALFTPGLFPRSVRDSVVTGSDHRAFLLTLAVRQPPT